MTEKRFVIDDDGDIVEFDWSNNEYITEYEYANGRDWEDVCNRLNELSDENEQLKSFINQGCPMCKANLELFYKEGRK